MLVVGAEANARPAERVWAEQAACYLRSHIGSRRSTTHPQAIHSLVHSPFGPRTVRVGSNSGHFPSPVSVDVPPRFDAHLRPATHPSCHRAFSFAWCSMCLETQWALPPHWERPSEGLAVAVDALGGRMSQHPGVSRCTRSGNRCPTTPTLMYRLG